MEKILKRVYRSRQLTVLLRVLSHLTVALSAVLFLYILALAYSLSALSFVKLAMMLGIPFIAVSLLRSIINAPRPYELYGIFSTAPKKKHGGSFPSRHAFSAFAIATATAFLSLPLGIAALVFSIVMCISRVLLGIHFIRDVAAGAALGALTSIIGILITNPF